jgi:hypothetical protein
MHYYFGPPMHLLSGVDTRPFAQADIRESDGIPSIS